MNIFIHIGFWFLFVLQVLGMYFNYRSKQINRIKRVILESLPAHDNYKFLVALHLYLTIRWDRYLFKDFFKPVLLGRMLTDSQLKVLSGRYDITPRGPLTNHELSLMLNSIKGSIYRTRVNDFSFTDKKTPDQYEF